MISILAQAIFVAFVATWFWIYLRGTQRGINFESKIFARWFLSVWLFLLLLNHFYFGPNSFLQLYDEGEIIIPWYKIVAAELSNTQYSHRLASGFDLHGSIVAGGEFLSPNRWLIANLPLWLALLIHKAIFSGVALIGAYLLVRRGLKQERLVALALAALFSVSEPKLVLVTFINGMSWGLLPLAAHMIVFRVGRRHYILGVMAFAIYAALFSSPNHVLFPLAATLFGAALVVRRHYGRIVIGSVIVVGAILVNWAESIHAMLQLVPFSPNATLPLASYQQPHDGVAAAIYIARRILDVPIPLALFVLGLAGAVIERGRLAAWTGAFLAPVIGFAFFTLLPWEILGLRGVETASGGIYSIMAWHSLGIIVAAPAFRSISSLITHHTRLWNTVLPALAIAVATGFLGHYKGHALRVHYNTSGQAMARNISNLNDKSLWPTDPFRIVSLSDRTLSPRPNIPTGFYGLDAFDGYLGLYTLAHTTYWKSIIKGHHEDILVEFPGITPDEIPWRGIEKVSLPLLAVANVRFFISPVPIEARGLRLINGPDTVPVPYQQKHFKTLDEKIRIYGWFVRKMVQPWKVYIYEIDGALPRAYVARGIVVTDEAVSAADFHAQVERRAPDGDIIVRAKAAERLGFSSETELIGRYFPLIFRLEKDGFFADWQGRDAGVAVFNAVYMPFFRAFVDDTEVPVVAVNGVQMAVSVPAGARSVRLVYRRPTLWDRMSKWIG